MIVKMKKVSLVIYDKYRAESVKELAKIGVLHIEQLSGSGEDYSRTLAVRDLLARAVTLTGEGGSKAGGKLGSVTEAVEKAGGIIKLEEERHALKDRINLLKREIERVEPLGDFNPEVAASLAGKGLAVTVCRVSKGNTAPFDSAGAFRIGSDKSAAYYAVVGEFPQALKDYEVFAMPEEGLSAMASGLDKSLAGLAELNRRMEEESGYHEALKKALSEVGERLEFETVKSGINREERLSYLTGFCPEPNLKDLEKTAAGNGWGLLVREPDEEDEVPTQLKMSRFTSMLAPVLDFLGILPGYREYDISFFFLCFFSIFTAMLIGDAGYGLLFLSATAAGMIVFTKKKQPIPKIFFLLLLLSITTIAWGIVTGTWFASEAILKMGPLESWKLDAFKGSDEEQIAVVMGISFFLGIVQLLIGIVQNFRKNFPKKSSFAQIGWFAVLIAVYYLVLTLVVKRSGLETYPQQMLYLLLGGVAIIFLFGGQEEGKSFMKGILNSTSNLLQLFLDVVGTFSDIMSYVRLFAVGLASVKIAETFNQLGAQMSGGAAIVFGILIVVIGHTLNIILGLMAILVHAVRLNILEYSGKVGVEWSGFKYKPFKVSVDESQNYRGEII